VLRVERELLQLEQEELKRQRENLLIRENLARHELDHGAKMLMSTNRQNSLQNINNFVGGSNNVNNGSTNNYANLPMGQYHHSVYQIQANYRQSMPDLQNMLQVRSRGDGSLRAAY
jgi:F-box protein 20